MKKLLAILFLLITNLSFSQLKAIIINSETKEPIPYVNIWVENENIGTTSNSKGAFTLEINSTKSILFSAIGFETKKIASHLITETLELTPQTTALDEVIIRSKKTTQEFVIEDFKKSEINSYFGCGIKPWIAAKYFKYNAQYNNTPFLKTIKILTNSNVKDSKFNIRLYGVNENGAPENYIHDQNILGVAKKGKRTIEIDISALHIKFPSNGFFIAAEWLIIEDNKYKYTYTMEGSKKKLDGISFEPAIGTVPAETDENSWVFNQGRWQKIWKNMGTIKKYNDKYDLMAIALTLSN